MASGYVGEAINFYLDRKYRRPFERWATPRLRLLHGLPINWNWSLPVVDPPRPSAQAAAAGNQNTGGGNTRAAATQSDDPDGASSTRTGGT